jgi:hypothetical protein
MKTVLGVSILATALLFAATDVYAMAWGEGAKRSRQSGGSYDETRGGYASVPEPSTLYAVGAGLALMGGAGWYIRRRK